MPGYQRLSICTLIRLPFSKTGKCLACKIVLFISCLSLNFSFTLWRSRTSGCNCASVVEMIDGCRLLMSSCAGEIKATIGLFHLFLRPHCLMQTFGFKKLEVFFSEMSPRLRAVPLSLSQKRCVTTQITAAWETIFPLVRRCLNVISNFSNDRKMLSGFHQHPPCTRSRGMVATEG